jgi:PAS domain S-box-containing protein
MNSISELEQELRETRTRLAYAEETLRALRSGEVDAALVDGESGPQVYILKSAADPYRMLIEQMREGALTVSPRGTILYCNQTFATMIGTPVERLVGSSILELMARSDLDYLAAWAGRSGYHMTGARPHGRRPAVIVSSSRINEEGMPVTCLVTDLTRQ